MTTIDPRRTALFCGDIQKGFLHPRGAYGRNGLASAYAPVVLPRVRAVADALRAAGGVTVCSTFTLVPGRDGEPLIAEHLRQLRPFLGKGDFAPGSFDLEPMDEIGPMDFLIEKVAYSAFYNTRLEFVLRRLGIETLLVCGVVTQGCVASTARDAHTREFHTLVLEDGCAAFKREVHDAAIADLRNLVGVTDCASAVGLIEAARAAVAAGGENRP